MAGKVRNYFAAGHTARGFYSLFDSVLEGLDHLYILKGGPGTGKSTLMRKIGENMTDRGYDIQLLHCASDNDSIDGIIVTDFKTGIVDGTVPHTIKPQALGVIEEYVNLGEACDSHKLRAHKQSILTLNENINERYHQAYYTFAKALRIHDEWEAIYIDSLDVTKANNVTKHLIGEFFANQTLPKSANVRHMFLGAATPQGPVDFIQNLTEDIDKRYFIKGRPGSGKSSMLKKITAAAEKHGFDVEVYHCGFDPRSLDMVLLPELSIAIFDSTSPHEHFPDRDSDEIVDMYTIAIAPGTDEKHANELADIQERYTAKMKEATAHLAEAKALRDELEAIYTSATDFSKIEHIQHDIQCAIDEIAVVVKSV